MTPTERDIPKTEAPDGARGDSTPVRATNVSTDGPPAASHVSRFRASLAWALGEYAETLAKLAK